MAADKVTLRLNAVATYRVVDAHRALSATDDARRALYREAQLALRAVIGGRELDQFLADKDTVAKELESNAPQTVPGGPPCIPLPNRRLKPAKTPRKLFGWPLKSQ